MIRTSCGKGFFALVLFLCLSLQQNRGICAQSILELANKNGDVLYSVPVIPEKGFAIRYIHSVAKTPVVDYFQIANNEIILDRTEYQDFGAGLPHAPELGQSMRTGDGRIIISGINRSLPEFELRVGRIAEHTLIITDNNSGKREVPLKDLAHAGSAIIFRAKTVN